MTCDMCSVRNGTRQQVRSFSLLSRAQVGGKFVTRGAGAIRLCGDCWSRTAAHRRRKGKGEYFPHHSGRRLTAEQVKAIRSDPLVPLSYYAERLGVSQNTVRDARRGRYYREIEDVPGYGVTVAVA